MKIIIAGLLAISSIFALPRALSAAEGAATAVPKAEGTTAAESSSAKSDLRELVTKVQAKLKAGKKSEADLADSLKEFDQLLAKHKGEQSDDVAQILVMKAMLYAEVLENSEKALAVLEQVKRDFPKTRQGQSADRMIQTIKEQGEANKVRSSLAKGTKFPDFDEKDLAGKPLSVANYKGKVVLVDFWATWCGPCVGELPNVKKTYKNHHPKGFEIIGVSLDSDEQKLKKFLGDQEMPWQQYFDGKGWSNKLAVKYGINSIPATFLLDGEGKIIASNLRGEALEEAVQNALAKR